MNSNNRIAATLFHRNIVCLRNISVNTLHKGDDDDDDNNNNNNILNMSRVVRYMWVSPCRRIVLSPSLWHAIFLFFTVILVAIHRKT